jgi:hypothetical protein
MRIVFQRLTFYAESDVRTPGLQHLQKTILVIKPFFYFSHTSLILINIAGVADHFNTL